MTDLAEILLVLIYLLIGVVLYTAVLMLTVGAWALGIAEIVGWVVGP